LLQKNVLQLLLPKKRLPDREVPIMNAAQIAPRLQDKSSHGEHQPGSVSTQVRCFVYQAGPKCYRAECIDLDIAAEGSTEKEARGGLRDAMIGYLSVTCEANAQALREASDEKTFRKLILRPAPVAHRIHYYIGKMKQSAFPKGQSHSKDRFYTVPAPCGI
jgi:hypothetical protein